MSNLSKLREQYRKNEERIAALQNKQKSLADKIAEQENLEIIGLVRSQQLTPEDLAALLGAEKKNEEGQPV